MKTLSLKIPEQLDLRISHEVARRKIAKSELVREALDYFFTGKAKKKQPSALDLARDLAGKYRSGVRDLASNPKHMEGFGE